MEDGDKVKELTEIKENPLPEQDCHDLDPLEVEEISTFFGEIDENQ